MGLTENSNPELANFYQTLEEENNYLAQCSRIYTSLELLNERSKERIANKVSFNDQPYLILNGVGVYSDKDGSKFAKVFAISKVNILYKLFRFPDPSAIHTTKHIETNGNPQLFSEVDLLGIDRIYYGDDDQSTKLFQNAIDNSIRHAIPKSPEAKRFKQITA